MDAAETTDDARVDKVGRAARVAAILLVLCVLYPLSLGPAVAIFAWAEGPAAHPDACYAAEAFYAPLKYLGDHTPLKKPLDRYVEWWRHLGARLR